MKRQQRNQQWLCVLPVNASPQVATLRPLLREALLGPQPGSGAPSGLSHLSPATLGMGLCPLWTASPGRTGLGLPEPHGVPGTEQAAVDGP